MKNKTEKIIMKITVKDSFLFLRKTILKGFLEKKKKAKNKSETARERYIDLVWFISTIDKEKKRETKDNIFQIKFLK